MPSVTLDHCVIHVTDWERSNAFYTTVLGAQLIVRPVGFAYRFGDRQLNVHGPGVAPALSGPTTNFTPSKRQIDPPPAATVSMAIIGATIRTPAFSVSYSRSYRPS